MNVLPPHEIMASGSQMTTNREMRKRINEPDDPTKWEECDESIEHISWPEGWGYRIISVEAWRNTRPETVTGLGLKSCRRVSSKGWGSNLKKLLRAWIICKWWNLVGGDSKELQRNPEPMDRAFGCQLARGDCSKVLFKASAGTNDVAYSDNNKQKNITSKVMPIELAGNDKELKRKFLKQSKRTQSQMPFKSTKDGRHTIGSRTTLDQRNRINWVSFHLDDPSIDNPSI